MTIKIVATTQELAALMADKMFEEMREHAHKLDDELSDAGMDDPGFLLMLLARLSSYLTEYAVYMSAGLYMATKDDHELAKGAAKAILKDAKEAAKEGLARAEQQAVKIRKQEEEITNSVAAMLKRASKTCH